MQWVVPKIWEGGDVYIIGGGPSMTKQFNIPDHIVQDVIAGRLHPSVYSSFMSCLYNKHVIGINIAYMLGNFVDIVFFGDLSFFIKHQPNLAKFTGLKVCCHPSGERYPWVKSLRRAGEHYQGISPTPDKVSWNGNSGSAAISVAAHAGAKRIILLGFDMQLNDLNQQHWHDIYGKKSRDTTKALPFVRHMAGFNKIQFDAQRLGIEILNCSQDSAIPNFRKITLKDVL